ncbi:hypothetical protein K438DRAFT_1988782 [Mycena galopus ATCC 62051]|nr:hypothetical protein K438DRAFT_1988782 [Mycena galopus ATCC 62051]
MELYSHVASWLPPDYLYEQVQQLKAPESSQLSSFAIGAFFAALATLTLRISANRSIPKCVRRNPDILVALKTFFAMVYISGTVSMLLYAEKERRPDWILLIAGVATAITFAVASISEHYHSIAPSTLTSLYAIVGTIFYAYPLRGLHEIRALPMYLYGDAAAAVSLFALVFLETKSKRSLLIPMDPSPAYESTLSFLVKPFCPHIVPFLSTGYRRRITLPELQDIPLYLRSEPATAKLLAALAIEDRTSSRYLVKSTFRAFGGHFLSPILPRLFFLTGTFAQVTLVEQMILYVSDKSTPKERGAWLIAGYFVVYVSLAISNYAYSEKVNAFVVLYRSALTGSLYAKTLRLTSMAARELGQGAATTYMSVDVQKVTNGFSTFQELWAAVVTIIIACTMLWYKAGYVMFAPLLFIVTIIASTSSVSRFVGAAQKEWLKAVDTRIKLLTSVLGQLLPIKLGAYEAPLEEKINALRKLETDALGGFIYYMAVAATLSSVGGSASFLVTLAAYAVMLAKGWGNLPPLDVSQIFTLFTIVNLLNGPLHSIGQMLPGLFASFSSLGRIQAFLQLPEKADSDEGVMEADLVDVNVDGVKESTVSLKGCTFAWDDKTNVLKDITLELAPRELHMVVGSVASGKSTLLMSILEETRLVEGKIKVKANKASLVHTRCVSIFILHSIQVALASQTPFIFPETLRANILLDSAYDEDFYHEVIHACDLRQDIETLPRRDMTKLGDKGTTLSGGQRQRLASHAIARAVYARADLILLDDVFSALDGETEAYVFASLFGPDGMLKGKTTVLVTHGIHHLPSADKVIVMDAGTITHFDSFEAVRDAGAMFALASTVGAADAGNSQLAVKESATAADVVDEEEDEELNWSLEQASRTGAYAFYIRCTGVFRAAGMFALIAMWSGSAIFMTAYLSMLASASSKHLGLWIAGYGACVAAKAVSLLYFGYTVSGFTAPHIHGAELAGIMGSPISWITKNPVGKILNRFSQDIQVADREFPFDFLNFAVNVLGMLGTFVFITMATPLLVFALPLLAFIGVYFLRFYLATSKQFRRLESASKSPLYTLFGTTVAGLITVRAYRAQRFFRAQNAALVNASQGALHHRVSGQLFLRVFLLWFQTILACGVALLTVWLRDTTSAAFLGVALSRSAPFSSILENGSISIDRIEEFAKLPKEEKTITTDEVTINEDDSSWPSAGSLTFSDFSMKYRDDLPFALKNLSFELQGGLKIGICGRALLRRKKIIVLDESTSSMDHITNEKIRHVVDTQMQGLTVLAIAHRISTIVQLMTRRSVAEFGDPKVLLSNPESRFARLAATQGIYHPDFVPNGAAVKELTDGTVMVVTEDLIDV